MASCIATDGHLWFDQFKSLTERKLTVTDQYANSAVAAGSLDT